MKKLGILATFRHEIQPALHKLKQSQQSSRDQKIEKVCNTVCFLPMAVKLPPALLPNASVSSLISAECRAILREEPDLSPSSRGAARAWALQPGRRSSPAPPLPAGAKMAPGRVHHLSLPLLLPVAALLLSLLLTGSFALCKCQDAGQLRRCSRRPRRFNLYI